jgi:hypothetical protein
MFEIYIIDMNKKGGTGMYPIKRPRMIINESELEYELILTLGLQFVNDILYDEYGELILVNKKLVKRVTKDENGDYNEIVNNNVETPFDITHNSKLVNILLAMAISIYSVNTGDEVSSFYQVTLSDYRTVGEIRFSDGRRLTSYPYFNQLIGYIDLIFMLNGESFRMNNVDMTLKDIQGR